MSQTLECRQCGSKLEFAPGEQALKCPFCGSTNTIDAASSEDIALAVQEQDFDAYLAQRAGNEPAIERQTVKCPGCGAQSQLAANVVADRCPFCALPIVAVEAYAHRSIRPKAMASFEIGEDNARKAFKQWIDRLWFAPSALRQTYRAEHGLKGVYLPYWTYDAETETPYQGERGENVYVTETYESNGQVRSRQVQRTNWYPAAGSVQLRFDDVLVIGSRTLPEGFGAKLGPWRLEKLQPYRDDYVAGFSVEAYQVGLAPGFAEARGLMEGRIREAICRDIGGDQQRILNMNPHYAQVSFKHILLPTWLSSYRYGDKSYRFIINGQTGAVQGERPYSPWKIAGAVVFVLFLIGLAYLLSQGG